MAEAGRRLAGALLAEADQQVLAAVLDRLPPGDTVEVVLSAVRAALSLPVELIRLATGDRRETAPLGLLAGVSVVRRPAAPGRELGTPARARRRPRPAALAGPLKMLAAVAAPDETKTKNVPLDTEAEMAGGAGCGHRGGRGPGRAGADLGGRVAGRQIRQALDRGRLPRAAPVRARLRRHRWSWRTRTAPRSR